MSLHALIKSIEQTARSFMLGQRKARAIRSNVSASGQAGKELTSILEMRA
jgi:hypothetical protein